MATSAALADALEQIQSERVKDRDSGVAALKQVLKANQAHPDLLKLKDKNCLTIIEVLSRVINKERLAFLGASRDNIKTVIANRLSAAASVFRHAVETTLATFRLKTLRKIIEHIISSLRTSDGHFCEPIALNHLKTLATVLSHQAHVEHLSHDEWGSCVDLCLEGIDLCANASNGSEGSSHNSFNGLEKVPSNSLSQRPIKHNHSSSAQLATILECLVLLTAVPSAPVTEKAAQILNVVLKALKSGDLPSSISNAIAIVRHCLSSVALFKVDFAKSQILHVLPVMKLMWPRQDALVKNQILMCLLVMEPFLSTMLRNEATEALRDNVRDVTEVMLAEYSRPDRRERGHLSIDDLILDTIEKPKPHIQPLQNACLALASASVEAEHNWTLLRVATKLTVLCETAVEPSNSDSIRSMTKKKPRIARRFDDLLSDLRREPSVITLHFMTFLVCNESLDDSDLLSVLEQMLTLLSSADADIASWAALVSSCCLAINPLLKISIESLSERIWQVACRLVTSISTSRAGGYLVNTMLRVGCISAVEGADFIGSMTDRATLNGPATLSDASLGLWRTVLSLRRREVSAKAFQRDIESYINWIFAKWSPSHFQDRKHAQQIFTNVNVKCLYRALDPQENPSFPDAFELPQLGEIGRIALLAAEWLDLSEYLLDSTYPSDATQSATKIIQTSASTQIDSPVQISLRPSNAILSYMIQETQDSLINWRSVALNNYKGIGSEAFSMVFGLCTLATLSGTDDNSTNNIMNTRLVQQTSDLLNELVKFLERGETDSVYLELAVQQAVSFASLPKSLSASRDTSTGVRTLAVKLEQITAVYPTTVPSTQSDPDFEFDSLQTDNLPQHIQQESVGSSNERTKITGVASKSAFQSNAKAYLKFLSTSTFSKDSLEDGEVMQNFIEYLRNLPNYELITLTEMFELFASSDVQIRSEDAETIIDHIAASVLGHYDYERCESTVVLCTTALRWTASLWTDSTYESLKLSGDQIYSWLIERILTSNIFSIKVKIDISRLLSRLIRINHEYAPGDLNPARSILLEVLKNEGPAVQFRIAFILPDIFGRYVLSQHEKVFDDIWASLSNDASWLEGLSLRLFILSRLGASWNTLLRRCVYYIFETAGEITEVQKHAQCCLLYMSDVLQLEDSTRLFHLLGSQLIYTWLDIHPLASIPYAVFGYASLHDLVLENEEILSSQSMLLKPVKSSEKLLQDLILEIKIDRKELIRRSFARMAAYALSKDAESTPTESGPSHECEAQIRRSFGPDEYLELFRSHFPYIIGYMFQTLQEEQLVEKSFGPKSAFKEASSTLESMRSFGMSDESLAPPQQPTWSSRYLVGKIERLLRRSDQQPKHLWTPFTVSVVARMILKDAHPIFGPEKMRRTVRRLRVLISLASSVAVTGYPLRLLLHALLSMVADKNCADEAIPLFQYLLQAGKSELVMNSGLLGGICIAAFLISLNLLKASQDSTTQESQYQAMRSGAKALHDWLSEYTQDCNPQDISTSQSERFRSFMKASRRISASGDVQAGIAKFKLLEYLLRDMHSDIPILSHSYAEKCLALICQGFAFPDPAHDDISNADALAEKYAVQVYQASKQPSIDPNFRIWAARVLGRSFLHRGSVPREISSEASSFLSNILKEGRDHAVSSLVGLCQTFRARLENNDQYQVAQAEQVLLKMNFAMAGERSSWIQNCLPIDLQSALTPPLGVHLKNESPHLDTISDPLKSLHQMSTLDVHKWTQTLNLSLLNSASANPVLRPLLSTIAGDAGESPQMFPYILHCVLHYHNQSSDLFRKLVSRGIQDDFEPLQLDKQEHVKILICGLLYLRCQPRSAETTVFDRNFWLDVDYEQAAAAAQSCGMSKTALLFVEIASTLAFQEDPRHGTNLSEKSSALLLSIYRALEEPDSYYGVPQTPQIDSIAARLGFEGNNTAELLMRAAQSDGDIRNGQKFVLNTTITSLEHMNLNNLAIQLGSAQVASAQDQHVTDSLLKSAMHLGQWDIPASGKSDSDVAALYSAFQKFSTSESTTNASSALDTGLLHILDSLQASSATSHSIAVSFTILACLTEASEILSLRDLHDSHDLEARFEARESWMTSRRVEDVNTVLTARQALFHILGTNRTLQRQMGLDLKRVSLLEVSANISSSRILRAHGSYQGGLANIAYLSNLTPSCDKIGLDIEPVVKVELSNLLWEYGELVPSIRVLQDLEKREMQGAGVPPIDVAGTSATLASRLSDARLEKPEVIMSKYLEKAQTELQGVQDGPAAAKVFHEFASHCHRQLENPEVDEELRRVARFIQRRKAEVKELERLIRNRSDEKALRKAKSDYGKAMKWLRIDETEYVRIRESQEILLDQSLGNYLSALAASEDYETDSLRFLALWLGHADSSQANETVANYIAQVPSKRFVSSMNQLASRMQNEDSPFQRTLSHLIFRICRDHPYHGMNHIFAGSRTSGGKDQTAISRNAAATNLAKQLASDQDTVSIWNSIVEANQIYIALAAFNERDDQRIKPGASIRLKTTSIGREVEAMIPRLRVPPITMHIKLRSDSDYADVPKVEGFRTEMSIAGGLSAPKVVTARASNGKSFKQLYKSGVDDLRQDAIMEQVFERVSDLLQTSRTTRQRKLGVRTYKVIPLDEHAGVIEFVPNTMSLNDFLRTAHGQYHPKDLKWDTCRNKIAEISDEKRIQPRVEVYRKVTARFSPVLRHFFFERYLDPDGWFERRLAYTRSTAAISILGHALGLGDRHCQNILLDETTGEVVHIDLGVAFEAGRVLTIPETVPFRLTRDVVDGFGILGTEGVFRRCCEFTLEALRKNKDVIMTILGVLRYDPLYSWSISPLRAKKLQEEREREIQDINAASVASSVTTSRTSKTTRRRSAIMEATIDANQNNKEEEGGDEADRALSVVEKKLSSFLSVEATVNELIQQASDETNLALLFCGWAAFA